MRRFAYLVLPFPNFESNAAFVCDIAAGCARTKIISYTALFFFRNIFIYLLRIRIIFIILILFGQKKKYAGNIGQVGKIIYVIYHNYRIIS